MEFLKEHLGDELYNQIVEKLKGNDKVKLANLAGGEYVGKDKFTALETVKNELTGQLKDRDTQLETLKKSSGDVEALKTEIGTLQETNKTTKETYETKLKDMQLTAAIQAKLTDTKYPDLLATKFDKGKLTLSDDGSTVLGIEEQLKTIKETYKDLFTVAVKGKDPKNNDKSHSGEKNPWSKEHFNLTEQGRLLKEDPELAAQLRASAI